MLSSKQIEIFYQVYKNNSMSGAAEKLQISQPSVSKTLAGIEKNLGFKLFLRKGKKLHPTLEANELFEYASLVTNQLKNFNYIANTYKSRSFDYINIGTTPSLAETIVPKVINNYLKENKSTRFNLINLNSIDLVEDRYKPDIDITICFNARGMNNNNSVILKQGEHKLVSPISFGLPSNININDLINYPYIEITNLLSLYSEESIMNYFVKNNIEMNFVSKSDSYSAALAMIEMGMGVSLIDDNTITRADLEKVKITQIKDVKFQYSINALIKKDVVKKDLIAFYEYLSKLD
jgi:DNA-binding transcriptional LysR family regulator|tara:strand:+ start:645 stop:1523 length:879 start_codon:yes stop_codon:yes gene_type:complete